MNHLAIGDYVYQRAFLQRFCQQYPHIELDIWIDDCRRKPKPWHAGRNQTLVQWLTAEPNIGHIYPIATDNRSRKQHIEQAIAQNYDLIVFFASHRAGQFARIARTIGPRSFVAGIGADLGLLERWHFRQLDACAVESAQEIADLSVHQRYQQRFTKLLGLSLNDQIRVAPLNIPPEHQLRAENHLVQLAEGRSPPRLFINHLSTSSKRDYQWHQVVQLIEKVAQHSPDISYILNVPPGRFVEFEQKLKNQPTLGGLNIHLFTAEDFFQLPAMIQCCDWVITVETAIMHLAACAGTPQVALIRESARAWAPADKVHLLFGNGRVDKIEVDDVVSALLAMIHK